MKKKFLVAAALIFATFTANAQEKSEKNNTDVVASNYKPQPKRLTLEVGFCPFQTRSTSLENGRLNGSYSFNEKWAIRAGLGWGVNIDDKENQIETTTTTFSFAPGVTYSFKGTERMTPYIGGEMVFGGGKVEYKPERGNKTESSYGMYGLNAFTGMNYYFSKNIYVGVEFGIGIKSQTSEDTSENEETVTEFAPYAQPSVRLGWTF